ncbi:MAG: carboxypeptidase-like regulatory domain-containing protein, partial [Saprospiraceae bacterium]|nr:carboxypeptidase-like regulatory domain-containing protein [Saprospiraceae bacterium]
MKQLSLLNEGRRYLLHLVVFFLVGANFGYAQVSGTITSIDGEPLIGVNILIKGTGTGTITDFDGRYSLDVGSDDILVFSYTGFAAQEIAVDGQSVIDVVLNVDVAQLSEVVVTGYTTQTKANLTGAVGLVSARELEARPITSAS